MTGKIKKYEPYLTPEKYQTVDLSVIPDDEEICMTNDYLFRALLQENNYVLKALVCALLHLDPGSVNEVVIQNPVLLGHRIEDKAFILDVKVILDNKHIVDIELQVVDYKNWPERSTLYGLRAFDNVPKGEDYGEVIPVTQIGIMDYTPNDKMKFFYYTVALMCEQNHVVYTDKFRIVTLDLTRIDQATDTDKKYLLDKWARLFKATTWKELKAMMSQGTAFSEAVRTVAGLTADQQFLEQYWAREDFLKTQRKLAKDLEHLSNQVAQKDQELSQKDQRIAELEGELAKLRRQLAGNP